MKHLRLLLLFFMTALFCGNALAKPQAKVLWIEGEATLVFVYDETDYTTTTYDDYSVTSIMQLSNSYSNSPWSSDQQETVTTVVFDESFASYYPVKTSYWFANLSKLTNIKNISNLNTDKVTTMNSMFLNCESLTSIDVSSFSTPLLNTISKMFSGCKNLASIDLSNFDMANISSYFEIFNGCTSLTTIYTDENLDLSSVSAARSFKGCTSLSGKCGRSEFQFDENINNAGGARVYNPVDNKNGYFTAKHTVKLNASGYATYASGKIPVNYANADGYTAWTVASIADDGETINFEQVTGVVPAGTGVLLMGTANGIADINFWNETADAPSNLLVGITAATDITDGAYYGLSGNEFVKVNAGTVPAHKALLPVGEGNVKTLTLVFNDETGIREVRTVSGEQAAEIFNLAGQRLQKTQKGVNIINGKKVLVK